MKYQNNVRYQGNFGGVAVTFTLQNFNQSVVEKYNEVLAKEAVKNLEDKRGCRVLH